MAEVNQAKSAATSDLLALRMEIKAARDNMDALLARVDAMLPEGAEGPTAAQMRSWGRVQWREFMESAPSRGRR